MTTSRTSDRKRPEQAKDASGQSGARHQHDASCHHLDAPAPLAGLARSAENATGDVSGGKPADDALTTTLRRRAGGGRPLDRGVAGDLGERMGADFSGVRVHADSEADTLARSVQATAFTLGSDVYFRQGAYAPGTSTGRSLLAHELTHVRQHQEGSSSGGRSGVTVGRTDDPAEREAEQVARTVSSGGSVRRSTTASGTGAPVARRSTSADGLVVRRLFGLFGATGVGQIRERELKSEDEVIPSEFIELVGAVKKVQGTENNDLGYASGPLGIVGGLKDTVGGGISMHKGRKHLEDDDSIVHNLGAQEMQTGTEDVLLGGSGMTGGAGGIIGAATKEIPGIDVATNFSAAAIKGKRATEDAVTSGKLGSEKVRIKREGDRFLPPAVRAKRFGTFVASLKKGSGYKRDDLKRWHDVHKQWVVFCATLGAGYDTTEPEPDAAKALKGATVVPGAGFNPLTSAWGASPTPQELRFLEWMQTSSIKEFGYGTGVRDEFDEGVRGGTETPSEEYSGLRDTGKVASFGQRRKGETATVGAIETAGHVLDGAGTLTAAGDMGATKLSGKVLKSGAAAYKGVKGLVKRARRVGKLAEAKNDMAYGGKTDRGLGWKVKQFFGGNVAGSMEKSKTAASEALANTQHDADHQTALTDWQQNKQDYDAQQVKIRDRAMEQARVDKIRLPNLKRAAQSKLDAKNPLIPPASRLADPGPAPVNQRSHTGKSAQNIDQATHDRLVKRLTLQCERRIDDLLRCLVSDKKPVRDRAKNIIHILAETNLAGALSKIKDADLDQMYADKVSTDATAVARQKKRMEALKVMMTNQLKGIGG